MTASGGRSLGLVAFSCVLATLLHAIDSTIVSVALPHIQGTLQATQDQAAWVATAYIVAAAIMTPLSGWLGVRFGLRPVLLSAIVGFTICSMLCGVASSIGQLVLFRALQGGLGAALVPLSQVVLMQEFPREKYLRVVAIWATASLLGPVIGPTLGGYLTDTLSWRWAFYINLPIGLLAWATMSINLPRREIDPGRPFDISGFVLLSLAVGLLQLMLDRGETADWFESTEIVAEGFFAATFFYMFIAHALTTRHPFVDIHMFRDRNFTICLFIHTAFGAFITSPSVLLPTYLQQLQGYTPTQAGMLMASRGASAVVGMFAAGHLPRGLDVRAPMITGVLAVAGGLMVMSHFTADTPASWFVGCGIVLGLGMPLTYVPIQVVAYATLPVASRTEAGVVQRLGVNIGGAVGISLMVAQLARSAQANQAYFAELFTPYATDRLQAIGGVPAADAQTAQMVGEVGRQALAIAYANDFFLLGATCLVCVPLILLLRRAPVVDTPADGTAEATAEVAH